MTIIKSVAQVKNNTPNWFCFKLKFMFVDLPVTHGLRFYVFNATMMLFPNMRQQKLVKLK